MVGDFRPYSGPTKRGGPRTMYESKGRTKRFVRSWMKTYGIRSNMQVARLIGIQGGGGTTIWRWLHGSTRPSSRYTQRLATLGMWHAEGIPLSHIKYVDWDNQFWVWKEGYGKPSGHIPFGDGPVLQHSEVESGH